MPSIPFEVLDCDIERDVATISIIDQRTHLPRRHTCKLSFVLRVLCRYMFDQRTLASDVRMIKRILDLDRHRHNNSTRSLVCFLKNYQKRDTDYRNRLEGLCACSDKIKSDIGTCTSDLGTFRDDLDNVKERLRINVNSISSILDRLECVERNLGIRPGRQYYHDDDIVHDVEYVRHPRRRRRY